MNKTTLLSAELLANPSVFADFCVTSKSAENSCEIEFIPAKYLDKLATTLGDESLEEVLEILKNNPTPKGVDDTQNSTLCDFILKEADAHPERIAIVDQNTSISYQALVKKAIDVSSQLHQNGVSPGSIVGLCMERQWQMVAGLLGIMISGCTYLPLDPKYPKSRIQYMLTQSAACAVVVDQQNRAVVTDFRLKAIHIDDSVLKSPMPPSKLPRPDGLAYLIYTSGSTGSPKGVAVTHANVVALIEYIAHEVDREALNGVLAATSICFDPSVMEIWVTLSLGGKLILADNVLQLPYLLAAEQVTTCIAVPSAVNTLLLAEPLPSSLNYFFFGGEKLPSELVKKIKRTHPNSHIFNVYGPTEDTVFSTLFEVLDPEQNITIGRAIQPSFAMILDADGNLVKDGQPGELHLGGKKVAQGYLNDPVRTEERFIELPAVVGDKPCRLYKTGDLCRWTVEGQIEFLGRVDQQVKVRGHRVELEEIESVISAIPSVNAAMVCLTEHDNQKILSAYIESTNAQLTSNDIKAVITDKLPSYCMVQRFYRVTLLPRLPNGKLDRSKPPANEACLFVNEQTAQCQLMPDNTLVIQPRASSLPQTIDASLHSQHTSLVRAILSEVAALTGHQEYTEYDAALNFEELGIDSLSIVELNYRISHLFDRKIAQPIFAQYSTANSLASFLLRSGYTDTTSVDKSARYKPSNSDLARFQQHIQQSHPVYRTAKANAWSATDKGILIQQFSELTSRSDRNPFNRLLRTGSATKGMVADSYTNEQREAIIWTTNLYLGLNRDQQAIDAASAALQKFGTGMGTSAAASGLTDLHLAFETEFAQLVGKQSACLFPTGYTANVGVVAGLLGKNDVVIIDQLCHASIVDGANLCGAEVRTFQHNNPDDLARVLQQVATPYRTILVAFEGVYSMGEGAAPVKELVNVAKRFNAMVLVDEAHSFGFYGERGAGICAAQGVTEQVDFIMTTLSKSLGSLGGVIACKKAHVDLLKASARAFIFQASVTPADIAAALSSLSRIRDDDFLREKLWDTTKYMRERFTQAGFDLGTGDGPIVTPHFADKDQLYAIVHGLYKRGIQTSAVTYPIVESGRGRLRFICSAAHTREDVDATLQALIETQEEVCAKSSETKLIKTRRSSTSEVAVDVNDWLMCFADQLESDYLRQLVIPDLALTIIQPNEEAISLWLQDAKPYVGTLKDWSGAQFSMKFQTLEALESLRAYDPLQLLNDISENDCLLAGDIEPFIWFIARLTELNQDLSRSGRSESVVS
ncbi:amino acid adenylation domain-containing protein [Pseudoalteromonas sp. T1lg23B]|uniref:amino acid adenylation domain-containing protein n=1 Tax=Pseudoalteromonas sp. T1lg23B TaxID=2077097 RepID=UPI000CF7311C|nr:amino acid adenylation domain-containing protein [Pseudoalteromonas sp. T1lg23B]